MGHGMSGTSKPAYKPGSPRWNDGYADGCADRELLCKDENAELRGPVPPDPSYPVMYNRGYEAGFQGE
jgi:hypothetical protein